MNQLKANSITIQTLMNQFKIQQDQTYEQLLSSGMEPIQAEIISGTFVDTQLENFLSASRIDKNIPVHKIIQQLALQKIYNYNQLVKIDQSKCTQLNIDLNNYQQAQTQQQSDDQFQIYDIKPKAIQSDRKQKSILLLGQTGAGKSTLINLLANYCYCESQNTQYRVRAIQKEEKKKQSESCTEKIETYVFMNRRINEQLVLIDTPGFGDTGGFNVDIKITNDLQRLLTQELNQIDMICLVKKEQDNRLDATNMYILGKVFSLFANDMKKNVHLIFTNSQFSKKPQALNLFTEDEEFQKILTQMVEPKFIQVEMGSEALFDKEEDDLKKLEKNFDRIDQLWNKFNTLLPQSLLLTQQVLINRENLIKLADDLNNQLTEQLNKLAFIQKNYNIQGYKQQTIQIERFQIQTVKLNEKEFVTNCLVCRQTCHYPCFIQQDYNKHQCTAMKNFFCTQCINKCNWQLHKNNDYRILYTSHIQQIQSFTIDNDKLIQQYMFDVQNYWKKYQAFINYLKQIAKDAMLPKSHLYFNDYILLQIQNEENLQNNGYQERVLQLKGILKIFKKIQQEHNKLTDQQTLDQLLNPLEKLIDIDAFKAILEENKQNLVK